MQHETLKPVTTLYSVWIPKDQQFPNGPKKLHGVTHIDYRAARALALRYRGDVREVSI
jgi:hypothetical protein